MTDLNSCPFCGAAPRRKTKAIPGIGLAISIECATESCPIAFETVHDQESWNQRHLPPEVEELIQAARVVVAEYETHGDMMKMLLQISSLSEALNPFKE